MGWISCQTRSVPDATLHVRHRFPSAPSGTRTPNPLIKSQATIALLVTVSHGAIVLQHVRPGAMPILACPARGHFGVQVHTMCTPGPVSWLLAGGTQVAAATRGAERERPRRGDAEAALAGRRRGMRLPALPESARSQCESRRRACKRGRPTLTDRAAPHPNHPCTGRPPQPPRAGTHRRASMIVLLAGGAHPATGPDLRDHAVDTAGCPVVACD